MVKIRHQSQKKTIKLGAATAIGQMMSSQDCMPDLLSADLKNRARQRPKSRITHEFVNLD
ncbi:hypothetical protein HW571_25140 [Agrobacterium genomosp. 3]|uniref:hypothetical protein n=1 Tax=Agrobacterium tomkonis TaxID=1183410 RepID=UPI001CD8CD81|nr:hypothetical protein [Agrobacterium tomkonis]MCA1879343.1 hypothetical protein [Agrobacterium tumefaciens]MCA1894506.1 hypothetical protein [Agrobacterium tomkonis]